LPRKQHAEARLKSCREEVWSTVSTDSKKDPIPPAKGTHPFVQAFVADVVPNIRVWILRDDGRRTC